MWVRSALVASVALGFRVDRSPRGALLKAPKTAASLGAAEGSGAEEEAGLSQEEVAFVSTPEEAPPAVTFISESPTSLRRIARGSVPIISARASGVASKDVLRERERKRERERESARDTFVTSSLRDVGRRRRSVYVAQRGLVSGRRPSERGEIDAGEPHLRCRRGAAPCFLCISELGVSRELFESADESVL